MDSLLSKLLAFADRSKPEYWRNARRGENLAYEYLRKQGYQIVATNYQAQKSRGEVAVLSRLDFDADQIVVVVGK